MESDALNKILDEISSLDLLNFKFVHDFDINADSLVKKKCPNVTILFDPNHFAKTQNSVIESYCVDDKLLKKLDERIKKFYVALLHDREQDLETKIESWKGMLAHFIASENFNETENSETIENLKELIKELTGTFSKVDANYSTNICESFHHSRSLLANKDIAWRLSWRLRAFISVIRWNCDNWVERIYKEFYLFDIKDTIATKRKKNKRGKNEN